MLLTYRPVCMALYNRNVVLCDMLMTPDKSFRGRRDAAAWVSQIQPGPYSWYIA